MTNEDSQILEIVGYTDLLRDVDDQLHITETFQVIIETRERLQDPSRTGLHGHSTGPCDLLT